MPNVNINRRLLFGNASASSLLTNLIGSWSLNSNLLANVNGYNGTGTNITYVAGKFGTAAYHDGTSSVNFGDITQMHSLSQFSISYWINMPNVSTIQCQVSKWDYATSGCFEIENSGGTGSGIFIFIADSPTDAGNNYATNTGAFFVNNTWQNVIMTFDGTQTGNANRLKVYIDNVAVSLSFTGTIPSTLTNATAPFRTGFFNGIGRLLTGGIDEINMWSKVLTSDERTLLQTKAYSF